MDKSAADAAKTSQGEDGVGAGALLRSASFLEKLEHARAQRQRVLAERAQHPDQMDDLTGLTKPWEQSAPGGPDQPPRPVRHHSLDLLPFEKVSPKSPAAELPAEETVRQPANVPGIFALKAPAPDSVAPDSVKSGGDAPEVIAPNLAAPAADASEPQADQTDPTEAKTRKAWTGWRVPAGFAFGAGLGLALTWALPALMHRGGGPAQMAQQPPVSLAPKAPAAAAATSAEPGAALPVAPASQAAATKPLTPAAPTLAAAAPDTDLTAQPPILPPRILVTAPAAPAPDAPPAPMRKPAPFADGLSKGALPLTLALAKPADLPLDPQLLPPAPAMLAPPPPLVSTAPPDKPAISPGLSAVSVHILAPKGAAPDLSDKLAATLSGAGYKVTETAAVGATITKTQVRFYHAADATAAAALAKTIGAQARDFTSFDPSPPTGTIEVWIAAKAPAPATKKKKPAKAAKAAPPPGPSDAQQLQDLRDKLLKELQNNASQ